MKIAIATDNNLVSEHFGHCEGFTLFEIKGNEVSEKQFVENPGHKPGFLPVFLDEQGVRVVISGGMGAGAINIFNDRDIEVITGASGDVDSVAQMYADDKLVSSGSVCNRHEHHDECGE